MNDHRLLQLVAAAVLAAAAIWVARHTYWDFETVDDPPQGEAARNRHYAFEHLTRKLGIDTREVATLRSLPYPDRVLLVDDLRAALLHLRIEALESWVTSGGRLLLSREALLANPGLQAWTGVGLARGEADEEDDAANATAGAPGSHAGCPTFTERRAGRETGKSFRACPGRPQAAFSSVRTPAWSLSNGHGFQMLRIEIGKGSVALLPCDCLMGNKSLLREDHARIMLDAIPLKTGDHIDILEPAAAEGLPVLLWRHAAAAIVCGLATVGLTIWRSLPRFGLVIASPPPLRRSLAEQIRARARFAWRTRNLASLRRAERDALMQAASRRLGLFGHMDAAQRIGALASRTGLDPATLREALAETPVGTAESQRAAILLLERARRLLTSPIIDPTVRA